MPLPKDPDCYWVEPGRLMAGEYPGDWSERTARKKLRALIESGVRTFVDLTEEGELESYDDWLAKEARAAGVDVAYHRHSIRDLDVPTSKACARSWTSSNRPSTPDAPVYVHCWGGIGRTGTVVCCWLVERGLSGEQALVEIALLREGIRKRQIRRRRWRGSRSSSEAGALTKND